MPLQGQAYAAILAKDGGPLGVVEVKLGLRIVVQVQHVAAGVVVAPAGRIHQPGGVVLLGPGSDFRGLELPPGLVERHPRADARIVVEGVHDFPPLLAVGGFGEVRAPQVSAREILAVLPFRVSVAAGHVLPHDDAQLVAIRVPARGFHLDVLTNHVEAQFLCLLYVKQQGLVGGGRVEPVGPPALVERAGLEERFVVQGQAHDAVLPAQGGEFPHRGVALHLVVHLPVAVGKRHLQFVEERTVGRPELHALRHVELHGLPTYAFPLRHHVVAVADLHLHQRGLTAAQRRHHRQRVPVDVGRDFQPFDVARLHRLHPHRLPDAGDGRVPDAARPLHLLPAGLRALVGGVPHLDGHFVAAPHVQRLRDVERERRETAGVRAHLDAVDPDIRLPVHRPEVEHHLLAAPRRGQLKIAGVPQLILRAHPPGHAGQRGFRRKGHQDFSLEPLRACLSARHDGIVPQAVQRLPVVPLQDGAGILRQDIFRIHLLRPWRPNLVARRFPLRESLQEHARRAPQNATSSHIHHNYLLF